MLKPKFLILALILVQTTLFAQDNKNQKPNILFIAIDDLRPQIGVYGNSQMITPTLDKFSSEAILFKKAYCNVPVCGASRASLLSGLRPTKNRFTFYGSKKDIDAPEVPSLPMWLKKHGYKTISRGKIYHHYRTDDLDAWTERHLYPETGGAGGWRSYQAEESKRILKETGRTPAYECTDVPDTAYPDGLQAEVTVSNLRTLSKSKEPFFLAVGFTKPHLPFVAPKQYWDMYEEKDIKLADNPFAPKDVPQEAMLNNSGELRDYYPFTKTSQVTDSLSRILVHGYYASVTYVDRQIGKVLRELENSGLAKNTIVIIWGDHGYNLGEHGLWTKHVNFEKALNTPLMIKVPEITKKTKTTSTLVEYVDLYPTLCELTGIAPPSHLQGRSFASILESPNKTHKKAIFSRFGNADTVVTERYVYTEWTSKEGDFISNMLYDHKKDPEENINLSYLPKYNDIVKDMQSLLQKNKESITH